MQGEIAWQPFRKGIEIHHLYGELGVGRAAALLRYAPGASLPSHRHAGFEQILVLQGSQVDERGRYGKGTMVVNPPDPDPRWDYRRAAVDAVLAAARDMLLQRAAGAKTGPAADR